MTDISLKRLNGILHANDDAIREFVEDCWDMIEKLEAENAELDLKIDKLREEIFYLKEELKNQKRN